MNPIQMSAMTLDTVPLHQPLWVLAVQPPPGAPEWLARLEEIGFLPGEQVSVQARGLPGHDPLVVRVGDSTFALRRAEAACISVQPASARAGGGTDA
ncbi:MAG: FeoA family protein [Pseudomonadota bacterium]